MALCHCAPRGALEWIREVADASIGASHSWLVAPRCRWRGSVVGEVVPGQREKCGYRVPMLGDFLRYFIDPETGERIRWTPKGPSTWVLLVVIAVSLAIVVWLV